LNTNAKWRYAACAIFLTTWAVGCGGADTSYEGAERAAVSGTVTFDGQPISSGSVTFISQAPDQVRSTGYIVDGKYQIKEGQGPLLGTCRVEFSWRESNSQGSEEEGEDEVIDQDSGEVVNARYEEKLPAKYTTDSEVTIEITAGENHHDFQLEP
jgi:hypothetical protein